MNKRKIINIFLVFLFLLISVAQAEMPSSVRFKYYMHKIFDGYVHSRLSFSMKEYDISDIHLKNMQEAVKEARNYMPEKNKDGTLIDRKLFLQRIDELQNTLLYLRTAARFGDVEVTQKLGQDVFDMCIMCHKEVKNPYLFRLPQRATIFGDYMHKIAEHMNLARIYSEEKETSEIEEQIKLIDYYMSLLEDTFPEKGLTGIIIDRGTFMTRLKELRGITKESIETLKMKKNLDIENYRSKLNGLCVACHEPERIK